DTNIWLERLLDQQRSEEIRRFLSQVLSDKLFMTDFSFHSIGIAMQKLDRLSGFLKFIVGAVTLLRVDAAQSKEIVRVIRQFSLDFDDAYQYVVAESNNLVLLRFDTDFDRTERKRKVPGEIVS
ncbi:MAG: PIN domain-containing protein, partial [Bacteroidetes bacterium]|nr:PIN domain-containing protein [Bacteroidota bacterium]